MNAPEFGEKIITCDEHGVDNELTSCWICFEEGIRSGERHRIIHLLKNPKCKPNDHDYNGGCNCDVIEVIKADRPYKGWGNECTACKGENNG